MGCNIYYQVIFVQVGCNFIGNFSCNGGISNAQNNYAQGELKLMVRASLQEPHLAGLKSLGMDVRAALGAWKNI